MEQYTVTDRDFNESENQQPYEHCERCELRDTECKVADKYQRLPRDKYPGALGMCEYKGETETDGRREQDA